MPAEPGAAPVQTANGVAAGLRTMLGAIERGEWGEVTLACLVVRAPDRPPRVWTAGSGFVRPAETAALVRDGLARLESACEAAGMSKSPP